MRCFYCHEPSPSELTLPRFCVRCGHPMAQPSPYLDGGEETYLALTDDKNQPPSSCAHSGGLLKACRQCGRLTELTAERCSTKDCTGPLVEPVAAFPSPDGSLDGTRTAQWRGVFSNQELKPKTALTMDRFSALAFRYGILVGVTPDSVTLLQPDGDGWKKRGRVRLENPTAIRSLLLEDGYAYVTAEKMTYRVPLSNADPYVEESITEACRLQANNAGRWVRLIEQPGGRWVLKVRDRSGEAERTIDVPPEYGSVNALALDEQIVLATAKALVLVNPQTGKAERLTTPPCEWRRVAIVGEKIVAFGYRETKMPVLAALTTGNEKIGERDLSDNYLADFAWQDDILYLATKTKLARFQLNQITRDPVLTDLSENQDTLPRLLAIRDSENQTRLLIRRRSGNGNAQNLFLVDPATGIPTAVGGMQISESLFCLADSRIVLGAYEGAGLALRTLKFSEGA